MKLVNRFAIIITPKQAFFDWINAIFPEFPEVDYSSTKHDISKIYLIKERDGNFDVEKIVRKYFREICVNEIFEWCNDDDVVPKRLTWKLFEDLFDFSLQSMIIDLSDSILLREDF